MHKPFSSKTPPPAQSGGRRSAWGRPIRFWPDRSGQKSRRRPRPTLCLSGGAPAAARQAVPPAFVRFQKSAVPCKGRNFQPGFATGASCSWLPAAGARRRCVFQARESSRRCFPYGSLRGAGVPRRGDSRLCMRGARLRAGRIGRSAPRKGSTPWRRSVSRGAAFRVGEEQAGACVR